jgi:type VI protein secretion system component VasF
MKSDPHNLRHHYAQAATRRRRAKALRTLAAHLALALVAGFVWIKMTFPA